MPAKNVAIVDYDAGNLTSVLRACREVGLRAEISGDPCVVRGADRVIFPGVGAAGSAMRSLSASGVGAALVEAFRAGTPILGICLGLQISLDHSEENDTDTLGIVPGEVRRFRLDDPKLKVPHMGWNAVRTLRDHPVLTDIGEDDEFYFVHAYRPVPARSEHVLAVSTYEGTFCSALGRDNYGRYPVPPGKKRPRGLAPA